MPATTGRRSSQQQREADQRGGEEAVVAVAEIDEHGREGERRGGATSAITAPPTLRPGGGGMERVRAIARIAADRAPASRLPDEQRERDTASSRAAPRRNGRTADSASRRAASRRRRSLSRARAAAGDRTARPGGLPACSCRRHRCWRNRCRAGGPGSRSARSTVAASQTSPASRGDQHRDRPQPHAARGQPVSAAQGVEQSGHAAPAEAFAAKGLTERIRDASHHQFSLKSGLFALRRRPAPGTNGAKNRRIPMAFLPRP